jgi:acetyl-CoA carboxylase biotin carboxyl carrier protein
MTPDNESALPALIDGALRLIGHTPALRSLRLCDGDLCLDLQWSQPEPVPAVATTPQAPDPKALPPGSFVICAPLVGTFFRAAEPGAPPFAETGQLVSANQQVAIIEAMKLMNPVESDRAGVVHEILLADGTPVEYGQALMVIVQT